jgi:hypothetical protein
MRRLAVALTVLVLALSGAGPLARDARAADDDDEFSTTWFGGTLEMWLLPNLSLHGKVGGTQELPGSSLPPVMDNSQFAANDLGLKTTTPEPTYLDFVSGPIVLGAFVDTTWVSLSAFWITPFEYKGSTVLTNTITYAGATFNVNEPVKADFSQSIAGFDIKVNLLNNRFVRLSPVLALRVLAVDWDVTSPFGRVSTENIDFPLTLGRFSIFPYPEVGAEVRAGYRDYIEADLKLTGLYINYLGVTAATVLFEAGVTGYLPFFNYVGLRLGYRYYYFDAHTNDDSGNKQFVADLRLSGMTVTLLVRF